MKKILFFSTIIILCFASCSLDMSAPAEKDDNPYSESAFEQAVQDFLKELPSGEEDFLNDLEKYIDGNVLDEAMESTEGEEILEMPESAMGVREKVRAYMYEAYYTGDAAKLEEYLKEHGLYDRFSAILKEYGIKNTGLSRTSFYDLDDIDEIIEKIKKQRRERRELIEKAALTGDILLGGGNGSLDIAAAFIPGTYKHAGIVDKTGRWRDNKELCVLSASNECDTSGFMDANVGFEKIDHWVKRSKMALYRVKQRDVDGANAARALKYGYQFVGRDFDFFTKRMSNKKWYCSKLVWRCWYSQGVDLDTVSIKGKKKINGKYYQVRDQHVTPQDIADDSDTYKIKALPKPPVAEIGSDMTVFDKDKDGYEDVSLKTAGTYDPENRIKETSLYLDDTLILHSDSKHFNASYPLISCQTINGILNLKLRLSSGSYKIRLEVTDDSELKGKDGITITVKDILYGDANQDGLVNDTDSTCVAEYYVGKGPSPFDPVAADVNLDGLINITDSLLISQYVNGIISQLPVCN
jgi:uncharacterized protein YycO